MGKKTRIGVLVLGLWGSAGAVHAEGAGNGVLSAEALARCASQVHTLRLEAQRLNQMAQRNDMQRDALDEQRTAISDDAAARDRYNAEAAAFNDVMARFRQDLRAINDLKAHYDKHCAQRSYRRAELEALPEAHQRAMRQGLADVRVPSAGDDSEAGG